MPSREHNCSLNAHIFSPGREALRFPQLFDFWSDLIRNLFSFRMVEEFRELMRVFSDPASRLLHQRNPRSSPWVREISQTRSGAFSSPSTSPVHRVGEVLREGDGCPVKDFWALIFGITILLLDLYSFFPFFTCLATTRATLISAPRATPIFHPSSSEYKAAPIVLICGLKTSEDVPHSYGEMICINFPAQVLHFLSICVFLSCA